MLFKYIQFGRVQGQNVGLIWVKNYKRGYFHTSYLYPNPVFPEKQCFHRLKDRLKDELKDELKDCFNETNCKLIQKQSCLL